MAEVSIDPVSAVANGIGKIFEGVFGFLSSKNNLKTETQKTETSKIQAEAATEVETLKALQTKQLADAKLSESNAKSSISSTWAIVAIAIALVLAIVLLLIFGNRPPSSNKKLQNSTIQNPKPTQTNNAIGIAKPKKR